MDQNKIRPRFLQLFNGLVKSALMKATQVAVIIKIKRITQTKKFLAGLTLATLVFAVVTRQKYLSPSDIDATGLIEHLEEMTGKEI